VPGNPSPALQVALAYFDAWTGKDLARAMHHIADDIVCDAPAGQLRGATAYREFLAPFLDILTGARMITAFGNDETAFGHVRHHDRPGAQRARRGVRRGH
jgi:ketosteroid isomerase-like protein